MFSKQLLFQIHSMTSLVLTLLNYDLTIHILVIRNTRSVFLTTLRSRPELWSRVRWLSNWASQMPQIFLFSIWLLLYLPKWISIRDRIGKWIENILSKCVWGHVPLKNQASSLLVSEMLLLNFCEILWIASFCEGGWFSSAPLLPVWVPDCCHVSHWYSGLLWTSFPLWYSHGYHLVLCETLSCYRISFPLVPTILGHATLKNEEVDQTVVGTKAKFIEW